MLNLFRAAVAAIALFVGTAAPARTFEANERTIYFTGVIAGNAIAKAAAIEALSAASNEPIKFVINSPGGAVLPGLQVISATRVAKARGVKFECFVPVLAASMAFQLLAECDERLTLVNTMLLWHPVKLGTDQPMDSSFLLYEGKELRRMERPLMADLIRVLKITRQQFMYHYRHETLWTAQGLQELSPDFITIIDDFTGVKEPFGFGE